VTLGDLGPGGRTETGEVIAFPNRPFLSRESTRRRALSPASGPAQPLGVLDMLRRLVHARHYSRIAATLEDEAARSDLLERARQLVNEAGTMGRLIRAGWGG